MESSKEKGSKKKVEKKPEEKKEEAEVKPEATREVPWEIRKLGIKRPPKPKLPGEEVKTREVGDILIDRLKESGVEVKDIEELKSKVSGYSELKKALDDLLKSKPEELDESLKEFSELHLPALVTLLKEYKSDEERLEALKEAVKKTKHPDLKREVSRLTSKIRRKRASERITRILSKIGLEIPKETSLSQIPAEIASTLDRKREEKKKAKQIVSEVEVKRGKEKLIHLDTLLNKELPEKVPSKLEKKFKLYRDIQKFFSKDLAEVSNDLKKKFKTKTNYLDADKVIKEVLKGYITPDEFNKLKGRLALSEKLSKWKVAESLGVDEKVIGNPFLVVMERVKKRTKEKKYISPLDIHTDEFIDEYNKVTYNVKLLMEAKKLNPELVKNIVMDHHTRTKASILEADPVEVKREIITGYLGARNFEEIEKISAKSKSVKENLDSVLKSEPKNFVNGLKKLKDTLSKFVKYSELVSKVERVEGDKTFILLPQLLKEKLPSEKEVPKELRPKIKLYREIQKFFNEDVKRVSEELKKKHGRDYILADELPNILLQITPESFEELKKWLNKVKKLSSRNLAEELGIDQDKLGKPIDALMNRIYTATKKEVSILDIHNKDVFLNEFREFKKIVKALKDLDPETRKIAVDEYYRITKGKSILEADPSSLPAFFDYIKSGEYKKFRGKPYQLSRELPEKKEEGAVLGELSALEKTVTGAPKEEKPEEVSKAEEVIEEVREIDKLATEAGEEKEKKKKEEKARKEGKPRKEEKQIIKLANLNEPGVYTVYNVDEEDMEFFGVNKAGQHYFRISKDKVEPFTLADKKLEAKLAQAFSKAALEVKREAKAKGKMTYAKVVEMEMPGGKKAFDLVIQSVDPNYSRLRFDHILIVPPEEEMELLRRIVKESDIKEFLRQLYKKTHPDFLKRIGKRGSEKKGNRSKKQK